MKKINNNCKFLPIIIVLTIMGCAVKPYYKIEPRKLAGTYNGTSNDGQQIVLKLKKGENGWSGIGTIGTDNIVFAESGTKKVIGKLIFADGRVQRTSVEFSTDNKVTLELGDRSVTLKPGGIIIPPLSGLFSGKFETRDVESFMHALFLTQSGNIITGMAIVLNHNAHVRGLVVAPNNIQGKITLPGETEMEFEARLDGKNMLIVSGLGNPVVFNRK